MQLVEAILATDPQQFLQDTVTYIEGLGPLGYAYFAAVCFSHASQTASSPRTPISLDARSSARKDLAVLASHPGSPTRSTLPNSPRLLFGSRMCVFMMRIVASQVYVVAEMLAIPVSSPSSSSPSRLPLTTQPQPRWTFLWTILAETDGRERDCSS
eukprot:272513-Rhodomonas_salina.1